MKLFVCGDIVNHTPGLDFIDESISRVIQDADYSVCNLEGAEIKEGDHANCPHQEPGTIGYLKDNGFNLMLLANNHITELGKEGVEYSIYQINKLGLDSIGAGLTWQDAYKPLIKEFSDLKIGILNICEAQEGQYIQSDQPFGYAWMGYDELYKDVTLLSEEVDYVIVFVHAGLEHFQIPLPEIREFYKKICDAGTSIVIGGHTHTAQGYEYYGEKLIVYSLGNFYFPYTDCKRKEESYSYSVSLTLKRGERIEINPICHYVSDSGKVSLVSTSNNLTDVSHLCQLLGDGYEMQAKKMCEEAYRTLCSHLLAEATCGLYEGMSFIQMVKRYILNIIYWKRMVIKAQPYHNSLILRLFENETYRWTIIRALKIKLK